VYPAVEYDYTPPEITVRESDWVVFQWDGSNTTPAGSGNGAENTDRTNIVFTVDRQSNFPASDATVLSWNMLLEVNPPVATPADFFRELATVGFATPGTQLDNAPGYYRSRLVRLRAGTYNFMCTRNNDFSNRSHKGTIRVTA
jgi:hypothetical protein